MRRITCLMLDMGGVLTEPQRSDKVDELMRLLGLACPREAFMRTYYAERHDYDRGSADAAEYWRRVVRALGVPFREASVPIASTGAPFRELRLATRPTRRFIREWLSAAAR